jgi:diketogulonate reductase-like aldo/keto reductase
MKKDFQNEIKLTRRDILKMSFSITAAPLLERYNSLCMENLNIQHNILMKKLPKSDQTIPVVGLGTWKTFDAGESEKELVDLKEVLSLLVSSGAAVIDSSPMYGSSESVIGKLSHELKIRNKLFLATKVWISGREAGIKQMNASFKKLNTTLVDLMQVHNLVDVHTHIKTLKGWKDQGKIKYFGITHYQSIAYPEMIKIIKKENPDFVQFNYNIADREAEKQMLPICMDHGVAVLINRPFEEGDLFQKIKNKPLPAWAGELDISSWAQFFLKFIISHEGVTCAIPGTSKVNHLKDNLKAGSGRMPDSKEREKMIEYYHSL